MCEFNDLGLASQQGFAMVLHLMTVIQVPVHLFGGYVILFKTPQKMKSVKMSMFLLHFWSSLLDITICFLIVPYVIFPIPGGIPLGFLSFLGVPPGYQASILIICASYTAISIINFYKNRHHSMKHGPNSQNLKTRLCRYVYIAANCVAAVAFLVPIYILHPGQRDIQKYTIETIPCLPPKIYENPNFFVASTSISFILLDMGLLSIFVFAQIIFLIVYSVKELQKRLKNLSKVTSTLQKRFSNALYAQVSIPMIAYAFPTVYVFFSWIFGSFSQACNNFVFISLAFHGLLSTFTTLAVHKPYRESLKVFLPTCMTWRAKSRVSSVREVQLSAIVAIV
ncbi:Serpentine Receptor, class H [Caenorhabditis elegans]|uniref:Serpentine Receptor, class H n=1 Tax=Caenorhabditis elegans TaxID=6239 RepID=Q9TZD7_CAEEL|nr:Serpentine Receptor, class H [Caenorhabditis elegans]CCD70475.1 Serpentine Receptor, class H [Caenorhabditis elegans]|eukprot:NP_494338.1 Serpentine Receptor, class H [Caenorhabditis elegans]